MKKITISSRLLMTALIVGAGIALVSPGNWFISWLFISLLLFFSIGLLYVIWFYLGKGRAVAWMIILAFSLRLITGIGLSFALPRYGYPEPCQQAGYLFKDACRRDQESYAIAQSQNTLFYGSGIELSSDQYGGLVYLSAWIYRYLSPDFHRPVLVLIAGAFFAAIGLPFFFHGLRQRWTERTALIAAWIYVLYPDAIFFSSSQMREPFLVGLSTIAFWFGMNWQGQKKFRAAGFLFAFLGMVFFSPRIAVLEAAVIIGLAWVGQKSSPSGQRVAQYFWMGAVLSGVLLAAISWNWMQSASGWDVLVTVRQSGWLQKIIQETGDDRLVYPIVAIYGLTQPVLPAAIADTGALPIWRGISLLRSAGWYLLIPFLIYGICGFFVEQDSRRRRQLIWIVGVVVAWLLIAAIRGGGDLTDNPRYRSLFIPWLSLLAGWASDTAFLRRSAFLAHIVTVEGISLLCFMSWYSARYFHIGINLPFWEMVAGIIAGSGMLLAGLFIKRLSHIQKAPE